MSVKSLLTRIFRQNRSATITSHQSNRSRLNAETLEGRDLMSAVLVVNTTQDVLGHDNGQLSLRQAILDANALPTNGADPVQINFNLPAEDGNHFYYRNDGIANKISLGNVEATSAASDTAITDIDPDYAHSWWSIKPTSNLPRITVPVVIDGYTQPRAHANDLAVGDNAVLPIVVDGSLIPKTGITYGLRLSGGNSTVQGLVMTKFIDGSAVLPNAALLFDTVGGNTVKGNFLGTDPSGTAALTPTGGQSNYPVPTMMGYGVYFDHIPNNLFGSAKGADLADRNVVAACGFGVAVTGNGSDTGTGVGTGNEVAGNFIGTDRFGTHGIGNVGGIGTVGTYGLRINHNLVSGNYYGILMTGSSRVTVPDTLGVVTNNMIGTDITGNQPIPNNRGISLFASNSHQIGAAMDQSGAEAAAVGNLIAFNTSAAVLELDNNGHAANMNSIRGNSIHDNGNGGIWLRSTTYPVPQLASATGGSTTTVSGTFTAKPNTEYLVDFYANNSRDAGGRFEGEIYLGTAKITTDASGKPMSSSNGSATLSGGNFTVVLHAASVVGQGITATLTDSIHNTSAFSAGLVIAASNPTVSVSDAGGTYTGQAFPAVGSALGANGMPVAGTFSYTYYAGNTQLTNAPVNAGTYTVVTTFTSSDSEYLNGSATTTFTISPAALTVRVNDASREYGQANPEFSLSYTGFVNGEDASVLHGTPVFSTDAGATSNAGRYPVSVSGLTADNYTLSFVDGVLRITPAGSAVNVLAGGSFTYDGQAHTTSAEAFGNDGIDLGAATISYVDANGNAVSSPVNVGVYTATASFVGDQNHTASQAQTTITIMPASLTVSVNDASRVYGQANPAFSMSYSGLVNGETASVLLGTAVFSTDAVATSPAGTYPISVSGLTADNYTINFFSGKLTVTNPVSTVLPIGAHETATIGFWQGPRGQSLLKSFNGGESSTALGNWLATSFPNIYSSLAGKTNAQVAKFYQTVFSVKGQKLDAQVMATAFNVYATARLLGGSTAQAFGFVVTDSGLAARSFNVGTNGTAFAVANNTSLTVSRILIAANAQSVKGVLWNGNTTLRNQANVVFTGINQAGDIGM